MRWGFKEEAKRLALDIRAEIGLDAFGPLDPTVLAEAYGIRVYQVSGLAKHGCARETLDHFAADTRGTFSAALLPIGTCRIIIENDNHAVTRRRANIAHEMSHHLLEHEFSAAILGPDGCRDVDPDLEDEATCLAGELLIPFKATRNLAQRNATDGEVASRYGVSSRFAAMRMNLSGARKIARRSQAAGGVR